MKKLHKILPGKNEYLKLFILVLNILIIISATLIFFRLTYSDNFIFKVAIQILILNLIGFALIKSFKLLTNKIIRVVLYLITSLFVIWFISIAGRLIYINFDDERIIKKSLNCSAEDYKYAEEMGDYDPQEAYDFGVKIQSLVIVGSKPRVYLKMLNLLNLKN